MSKILSDRHWLQEGFKERMTDKEWQKMLLEERDTIIFNGHLRQLVVKKLGYGVVEVSKKEREVK